MCFSCVFKNLWFDVSFTALSAKLPHSPDKTKFWTGFGIKHSQCWRCSQNFFAYYPASQGLPILPVIFKVTRPISITAFSNAAPVLWLSCAVYRRRLDRNRCLRWVDREIQNREREYVRGGVTRANAWATWLCWQSLVTGTYLLSWKPSSGSPGAPSFGWCPAHDASTRPTVTYISCNMECAAIVHQCLDKKLFGLHTLVNEKPLLIYELERSLET